MDPRSFRELFPIAGPPTIPVRDVAVPWDEPSRADPLADVAAGGLALGRSASLYVTMPTMNWLARCVGPAVGAFDRAGLPMPIVHDGGELDRGGVFRTYVPDGHAILVGRDGARTGDVVALKVY